MKYRVTYLEFHEIIQEFVTLITVSKPLKSTQQNADEFRVYRTKGSKLQAVCFYCLVWHVQCLASSRSCHYYLLTSYLTVLGCNDCLGDISSIRCMLFMKHHSSTGVAHFKGSSSFGDFVLFYISYLIRKYIFHI